MEDGLVDGHPADRTQRVQLRLSLGETLGLRSMVAPLRVGWEQEFYSVWLLEDKSCNWPYTHSLSLIITSRPKGRLNNWRGAHCQCFRLFSGCLSGDEKALGGALGFRAQLKMSPMAPVSESMGCGSNMYISYKHCSGAEISQFIGPFSHVL